MTQERSQVRRAEAETLLNEYRNELIRSGVSPADIRTVVLSGESLPESARVSSALGIIQEMKSVGNDIVVLGRRGNSSKNESLTGSVADQVAREAAGHTICIVD